MKVRLTVVCLCCAALICAGLITWRHVRIQLASRKFAKQAASYRVRADQGDAEAQARLGAMYYHGRGVPQDFVEAARWYHKSAEQQNAKAEYALGDMYHEGKGVPQDTREAILWIRKAAEQGDAMAEDALGYMYYRGEGIPRDFSEAARWYGKSAEQGYAKAQYDLGYMYYYGYGVAQNKGEANRLFQEAAARGDEFAKRILGPNRICVSATSKIFLTVKCLGGLIFVIVFLKPDPGRARRIQIETAITALLLLCSVAADLLLYFRIGFLRSSAPFTALYLARYMVDGAVVAMLIPIIHPKSRRTLLITAAALLIVFLALETAYAALRQTPLTVWGLRLLALPIGMSIPAVILLWLGRNERGGGKRDAAVLPIMTK